MNTVKSFKEKGLVFVKGDGVGSNLISDVHYMDDANIWNLGSKGDEDVIRSFAWRSNTGVKPEYEGKVEVFSDSVGKFATSAGKLDWSLDAKALKVAKWRPHLEYNTSTPEEDEAFNRMEEVKPVFTQEMADRNEAPPIGSEFRIHKSIYFMVGLSSGGSVVGEHPDFMEYKGFHAKDCKPPLTSKQKAINNAYKKTGIVKGPCADSVFERLYDAKLLKDEE